MESIHDAMSDILGKDQHNGRHGDNHSRRPGRRGSNTGSNYDFERQSMEYEPSVMPHTNYIPEYRLGRDDNTIFPIQEVIPNSQDAMEELAARSRRQRAATATINANNNDFQRNNDGLGGHGENGDEIHGEEDLDIDDPLRDNVPMMVKPKILHQNPQTPTVLPSTFHPISKWSSVKRYYLKEFLAEFLGTMMMVFFGQCIDIQVNAGAQIQRNQYLAYVERLNRTKAVTNDTLEILNALPLLVSTTTSGTADNVPKNWAAAVVMGYFAAGGSAISGAHLNPAATVTTFFFRGFPARKMPFYFAGQLLGGFMACLLSYIYYKRVIMEGYPHWYESETVAGFFVTSPKPYLSTERQITSEFMCTAAMQLCVFALTDPYTSLSADIFPLLLFLMALVVNSSMSFQTGSAMNAARDLGPRLALWALGFDRKNLWIHHHRYFWVPMIVPFWGSMTGALLYDFCIYQGHESPVNWPLSLYKEKFMKLWHRRLGWKNRTRKRRTSDLSDFSYQNDDDDNLTDNDFKDKPKTAKTNVKPNHGGNPADEAGKFVRFQSVSQRGGRSRHNNSTTILEEDSIETASLGHSQSDSVDNSDKHSIHNATDEKVSY